MFHKVDRVKIVKHYILEIMFEDGTIKYYDVSKLFEKWNIFRKFLNEEGLFEQVKVDKGGYGISWNDEIDLSCNELWENGKIEPHVDSII